MSSHWLDLLLLRCIYSKTSSTSHTGNDWHIVQNKLSHSQQVTVCVLPWLACLLAPSLHPCKGQSIMPAIHSDTNQPHISRLAPSYISHTQHIQVLFNSLTRHIYRNTEKQTSVVLGNRGSLLKYKVIGIHLHHVGPTYSCAGLNLFIDESSVSTCPPPLSTPLRSAYIIICMAYKFSI